MIKFKFFNERIKITPLTNPLVFRVVEHYTKIARILKQDVTLHQVVVDNEGIEDPNARIAIEINCKVDLVAILNMMYYQNKYWMRVRYKHKDYMMDMKELAKLLVDTNFSMDYIPSKYVSYFKLEHHQFKCGTSSTSHNLELPRAAMTPTMEI